MLCYRQIAIDQILKSRQKFNLQSQRNAIYGTTAAVGSTELIICLLYTSDAADDREV